MRKKKYTEYTKKSTKRQKRSWIRRILFSLMLFCIWSGALVAIATLWFIWDAPDIANIAQICRQPSVVVKDKNGIAIATYGDLFAKSVSLSELPSYVPQAVIAVEDRRFYHHCGVDVLAIARAFMANRKAGYVVQGGSTLTQQLAKNILVDAGCFPFNDQSYKRKFQELFVAFQLERKFTKDQILTLYLNRVYLGARTFGIDAAARQYFNKPAQKLTVFEAAVIAGLLKAPSKYSLHSSAKRATERATTVLKLMEESKFIKDAQFYLKQGLEDLKKYTIPDASFRYFGDWIYDSIGLHAPDLREDIEVTTTFDIEMQRVADALCRSYIAKEGKALNAHDVSFVAMSPQGEVRAMVGGKDYNFSQFNLVTQAIRQAGSAIKPLIYLAALKHTGLTLNDRMDDSPFSEGNWSPSTFGWKSRGTITLYEALCHSVNSVTIRLLETVGLDKAIATIQECGIYTHIPRNKTIALGTVEVTLLDLTAAFASFSNGGCLTNPHGILMIKNRKGKVLYERKHFMTPRIMSEAVYHEMRRGLLGIVCEGSGRRVRIGNSVFGKTGSNGDRDAWFIGFREGPADKGFSNIVFGAWVGNANNMDMKKESVGARIPAMICRSFLLKETPKS